MAWLSSTSLLMSPEICICQRGQGQPHAFWKRGQMSQGLVPHSAPWTRGAGSMDGTRFAWDISETRRAHCGPHPWTLEAPGAAPLRTPKPLALFLTLQTLVGKDGEAFLGPVSRGIKEGACQEQMRLVCLSRPVSCLLRSSRPPLSAQGAKEAPWEPAGEGCAKLHESQAPRQSLAAPARRKPVSEMHGGIKCSPN